MASISQSSPNGAAHRHEDPFVTPLKPGTFADLDNDSPSAYTSDSPGHAKRVLEEHIADINRRIKQASTVGSTLVDHRRSLQQQLIEVETTRDEPQMDSGMKQKLLDLEKAYNDLGRESARSFIPRSRYASAEGANRTPSPAKISAPSGVRKQRNPPSMDARDLSSMGQALSDRLVDEVRDLRTQLAVREEQVRDGNNRIISLQTEVEGYHQRMRNVDDDEEKIKDANWTLETQVQDISTQLRDALLREERLTKTLNAAKGEKSTTERELEELKATHYQLSDDHSAFQKQHETDVSGLRRTVDARESEQELMQRKIDELTTQNQELAKAVAYRMRSDQESGTEEYASAPLPEEMERSSPDGSPPPSPSKATPARHGGLEHETMRSSLAHLQKRYQAIQSNLHREKTEKIELRRLLQDARDELERREKDSGLAANSSKRVKPRDNSFKKPARPDKLGGSKNASEEVWEDYEGSPHRRTVHHRAQLSTDGSDAYATANDDTDNWNTANERNTTDSEAFATGVESMANSSDELTETEDGPSHKRVTRMPSYGSSLRRQSFLSTASLSDEDSEMHDVQTPTSGPQRFRSTRLNRSGTYKASPSMRDSPASFVSHASNSSAPRSSLNLAAELEDFNDSASTAASTPSRSISREASPRLEAAPPVPPMPLHLFQTDTKDSGTLTDVHGSPKPAHSDLASKASAAVGGGVIGGIAGALFGSNTGRKSDDKELSQAALDAGQNPKRQTIIHSPQQPSQAELNDLVEKRVKERMAEIEASRSAARVSAEPQVDIDALVNQKVAQQIEDYKSSQPKQMSASEIDALVSSRAIALAEQAKPTQQELDALVSAKATELAEQSRPKQHEIDAMVAAKAAELHDQSKPKQHEIDALVAEKAAQLHEQSRPKQHEIDALVATKAAELHEQSKPKPQEIDALVAAKAAQLHEQSKPKQHEIDAQIEARARQIAAASAPSAEQTDALIHTRAREMAEKDRPSPAEIDALVARKAEELHQRSQPKQSDIDSMIAIKAQALADSKTPKQADIDALIEARAKHYAATMAPSEDEIDARVEERARVMASDMVAARERDSKSAASKATPTHVALSQLMSKAHSREATPASPTLLSDGQASSPEEETTGRRQGSKRRMQSMEDPFRESGSSFAGNAAKPPFRVEPRDAQSGIQEARQPLSQVSGNQSKSIGHPSSTSSASRPVSRSTAIRNFSDEGTQTSVSSEPIDAREEDRGQRSEVIPSAPPRAASHRDSPSVSKLPEGVFIRRPPSNSSLRTGEPKQAPPLPSGHREAIAAATSRTSSLASTSMTPPPIPKPNPLRPRTPSYSQIATNKGSTRRRDSSAIRAARSASRRSSVSSFASEVDNRLDLQRPVYPEASSYQDPADPRMIAAITQTMIGEFMWKYTRKAGRADHSENRHRRFFWIHPYTRTLYWSTQDPSHAGKDELKAKSVAIEAVRVVGDDNPLPPGLHTKSLVIVTPGRSIKVTAPTSGRHETWFNALSYLLLRANEQPALEGDHDHSTRDRANPASSSAYAEDLANFDPHVRPSSRLTQRSQPSTAARIAAAPSPHLTQTPTLTRTNTAIRTKSGSSTPSRSNVAEERAGEFGEFKKPRPPSLAVTPSRHEGPKKSSFGSRLSNMSLTSLTRRGRGADRSADEERRRDEEEQEQLAMPLPSPTSSSVDSAIRVSGSDHGARHHHHHHDGNGVENVRACCDGKHDVAHIPFRSSSSAASVSSRRSFSLRGGGSVRSSDGR